MKYTEFRDAIKDALKRSKSGMTWAELRDQLNLPYDRPCPEWTKRLEQEIGLKRIHVSGRGRAYVWSLDDMSDTSG
ncbi:MAG: hypothetical protein ACF8OB_17365 [Phycisphaeraceae bacterium JB051]